VRERDPAKTLASPHGYAWVTLRTVAISEARGASIEGHRIRAESSSAVDLVASLPSPDGTPEQLDRQVLLNEFRAQLTKEEELVFSAKLGGYSSRQIAEWRGCSPEAIDNMLSRIRKKLRAFVEEKHGPKQPPRK
jgi:RNA polymerase sigma factor (sigma-70 family)